MSTDPAAVLAALPGVAEASAAAREACERLRWHPAMRRRSAQVKAEAAVWHAWASGVLEGARLPVAAVRAAAVGATPLPADPVGLVVSGALRAGAEVDRLALEGGRRVRDTMRQSLASLHLAAAQGLVADELLGRPRPGALGRLNDLIALVGARSSAPATVVAAVAHAELAVAEPFESSNAVVGRAVSRALVIGRGLDPMGAAVPEWVWVDDQAGYRSALAGYAEGGIDGVGDWLCYVARTTAEGAERGLRLADAVLAGRPLD